MRSLQVTGVLPASMAENSGAADWAATLDLSGDLAGLSRVEILGRDALFLAAAVLPGLPAITLSPGGTVDYEAFVAAGRPPVLEFALRFVFEDGEVVDDPTPRSVAVLDRDDTPPTALAFATGGALLAGVIGAPIGTLRVTDPDSAGPFQFSVLPEDEWRFEVVGDLLKLKDGISLGLDDMPLRPLIVTVSDGRQAAAFQLDLRVADPWSPVTLLPPGETRAGLQMMDGDTALAIRESRSIARVDALADGGLVLTAQDGTQAALPAVHRTQFLDGFQDAGPASPGVRAAALVQAGFGQAADPLLLAALTDAVGKGTGWTELGLGLVGSLATASAEVAVTTLMQNALGRAPTAEEMALHAGRLASGSSIGQVAVDIALSSESLARQPATGVWVADPLGEDGGWRGGKGGLLAPAAPPAAPPLADPVPAAALQDLVWLL
ncbi:DUF4214 domain-containing protein [Paracraurococcus ruber]|uniref:DUF4214 domain-containing protein n=1 Tax=Paracraurococcus ruber TaxID=77675 RepID=UPI0010581D80|nr:DUF4214 domain-containing protein [Paracraurococcus ruber]TDG30494.1 DUF4214 domain-containing protein [Paracraurococcus ruber]